MGASRRTRRWRERGGGEDGGDDGDDDTPEFVVTAPNVTCLYPREGNCHAFVAGPNGAAMLDVLFPPYDEDDGRECMYYESRAIAKEEDGGDDERRRTLVELVPVDRPDDFNCLGGSYGRFGSD
jgi:cysteamine dioxygenase